MDRFKDAQTNPLINPVDWFNWFADWNVIFDGNKSVYKISETQYNDDITNIKKPSFELEGNVVHVLGNNNYDLANPMIVTKFMLLTAVKFKGSHSSASSWVSIHLMKQEMKYIRVSCDYFKLIKKINKFGSYDRLLKSWKKDEIKQDHDKNIISHIPKYDDFVIVPDNKNYQPVIDGCYNLYSEFPHKASTNTVSEADIPSTMILMNHIFGDQVELGIKYMKILYEHPQQILPVIVLVSIERGTGKTTFLNWIDMLFRDNSILINPEDILDKFNSGYAVKNIIMIDELILDKTSGVEKLKALATAKKVSINPKFVQQYSVPFYGKIIMATNKEKGFMKIDKEEIRFWIRKIPVIPQTNHNINIENDLFKEIPAFLKYLEQLPDIDFTKSRMVFTAKEISTDQLSIVKEESKSALCKELEILFDEFFIETGCKDVSFTVSDIKSKWFNHNHHYGIKYIGDVLRDEFGLKQAQPTSYKRWNLEFPTRGRIFTLKNPNYVKPETDQSQFVTSLINPIVVATNENPF